MTAYSAPGFQERAALARQSRQKALDQLRAKPPMDAAVVAARAAARLVRDEAATERRRLKSDAENQAKADRQVKTDSAKEKPSEADKKAARDARYAARKKK